MSGMGHIVEQISRPREILDRYDAFAPDIVFLDIFMPEFNGIDVANWLVDKRFNGKLVFMTGYDRAFLSAARSSLKPRTEADIATLEKPARTNQIREILNG